MRKTMTLALSCCLAAASAPALENGDFSRWEDGKPVAWDLGEGEYAPEELFKLSGRRALRMKTDPAQTAAWLNNTVSQTVRLEPRTTYVLSVTAAKEDTGTFQFHVVPLVDGKRGPALGAASRWVWGFPFTTFTREFTTGAGADHIVEIRHFGNADAACFLDRVVLSPKRETAEARPPGLYRQSTLRPFAGAPDRAAEPLEALDFTLCRNETEAVAVLWKAPKAGREAVLAVRSTGGLPEGAVTVRDRREALLPPARPRAAAAGETLAWHVSVASTSAIAPGEYTVELALRVDGATEAAVPASVRIVDVELPPADIAFFQYYNENYIPARYLTPELREAYYRDMVAHGMNTLTVYNNPQDGKIADFTKNQQANPALMPEKHRNGEPDPAGRYDRAQWEKIFAFGLEAQMELALRTGLVSRERPVPWLVTRTGNYGWGGMPVEPLKDALAQWRARDGWPEPLLYVQDEPYDLPDRIADALRTFDRLDKGGVEVRTVTAHPHPDILGDRYDVWILGTPAVRPDNAQKAERLGSEIWCYTCNTPNDNAAFFRALYGFWAQANAVRGVATWAYYDAREQFAEQPDGGFPARGSARLSQVGLTPAGPVPTPAWEATREGTEDYRLAQRYRALLKELVARRQARLDEAGRLLSAADQSALRKREEARYRKAGTAPAPTWQASGEEQARGEAAFLAYLELDRRYRAYKKGEVLLETVGSLAPFARRNDDDFASAWYPDLGENRAPDDAEVKRGILLPYVAALQTLLSDKESRP